MDRIGLIHRPLLDESCALRSFCVVYETVVDDYLKQFIVYPCCKVWRQLL